jgi:hypothetical protein
MARSADCDRLQLTRGDRRCCYTVSGRERRPDYACHSAVGNWSLVPFAYCAFPARSMAATQRLGIGCRFGSLLLWAVFRPVQYRNELHDGGSCKSCTFNSTSPDDGRWGAARDRAADQKKNCWGLRRYLRRFRRARIRSRCCSTRSLAR